MSRTWTHWGDRLAALVLLGTAIGLAYAWIMQYATPDGNAEFIERISHAVIDPTWMPPGTYRPEPLIGFHYFGDLQMLLGYGLSQNPYIISGMPSAAPPLGVLIFKALGVLGPSVALIAVTVLSLTLIPAGVWFLMGGISFARRIVLVTILVFMTLPMLVALDRGGLQFLAFGLVAVGVLAYQRSHPWLALALIVAAVSLKTYLLLLLLYPLLRGHRRFAVLTLGAVVALNGILFLVFPGRPTVSLGGFLTSNLFFSSTDMVLVGTSLPGVVVKGVALNSGRESALQFLGEYSLWLTVLSVLWLGLVLFLTSRRTVPFWISWSLILASAPMVVGASMPYSLGWASIAAFYFGSLKADPFPFKRGRSPDRWTQWDSFGNPIVNSLMRSTVAITISLSLIPQFGVISLANGQGINFASLAAPIAIFIATILSLVAWCIDKFTPRESPQADE